MKVNSPDSFVDEFIEGLLLAHSDELHPASDDDRALNRTDVGTRGKVDIVTGGGSGHLPFFLGYVGRDLESGAATGNMFSSPSAERVAGLDFAFKAAGAAVGGDLDKVTAIAQPTCDRTRNTGVGLSTTILPAAAHRPLPSAMRRQRSASASTASRVRPENSCMTDRQHPQARTRQLFGPAQRRHEVPGSVTLLRLIGEVAHQL